MSGRDSFRWGSPTFNGAVQISFTSDPAAVSGVLVAGETYRISSDANCMFAFSSGATSEFALTNGAYLAAGEVEWVTVAGNSVVLHAVSAIGTTSGLMTCNKVTK